jgi:hypothetical protein
VAKGNQKFYSSENSGAIFYVHFVTKVSLQFEIWYMQKKLIFYTRILCYGSGSGRIRTFLVESRSGIFGDLIRIPDPRLQNWHKSNHFGIYVVEKSLYKIYIEEDPDPVFLQRTDPDLHQNYLDPQLCLK